MSQSIPQSSKTITIETQGSVRLDRLRRKIANAYQSGQRAKALRHCQKYLSIMPDDRQILPVAGLLATELGRRADAIKFFNAQFDALNGNEATASAYLAVAVGLEELNAFAESARAVDQALARDPGNQDILTAKARILEQGGDHDAARELCEQILSKSPENGAVRAVLGVVYQKRGELDAAIDQYRQALNHAPDLDHVYGNLATALLQNGAAAELAAICRERLERAPGDVDALSFLGLALNEAGQPDEAAALLDFGRFVKTYEIDAPKGFADREAFDTALEDHVLAHPTYKHLEEDDPGFHHPAHFTTGELFAGKAGPMAAFEQVVVPLIDTYKRDVLAGPAHPYLANPPEKWRLSCWGTVLDGEGHLVPHIHSDAFLSGVYYPRVPSEIAGADQSDERVPGAIEIGRPPDQMGCRARPLTKQIRPQEGMLLLFPASVYHCTVPFEASSRRLSISFDVVPVNR